MSSPIYIHSGGEYDRARWLNLNRRPDGHLVFVLQDLCHPGLLSSLKQVTCPFDFVDLALKSGTLQVTTSGGYMLIRSVGDHLSVEFRGSDDVRTHKVTVLREEVRARVAELAKVMRV